MDDRWESEISEFGAINITGFRIVDENRRYVQEFLDGWKSLDPSTSIGAGKESISVRFSNFIFSTTIAIQVLNRMCVLPLNNLLSNRLKQHWCMMRYSFWSKHLINYFARNRINFAVTQCVIVWDSLWHRLSQTYPAAMQTQQPTMQMQTECSTATPARDGLIRGSTATKSLDIYARYVNFPAFINYFYGDFHIFPHPNTHTHPF